MSKKKRLVVNVSEKVSEAIWRLHCDQKISQSRIVERILEANLEVIGDQTTDSESERFAMVNQS
jgi:hypothetical protein